MRETIHEELRVVRARSEPVVLGLAAVFLFVNFAALTLIRPDNLIKHALEFGVWALCALVGHLLLNRFLPQRDSRLFPIVMFLSGWGIVIIDRLAPGFAQRQTIWLIVSVFALLATATLPHFMHWLRSYRYIWLTIGLLLLVSTIAFGRNPSGQLGAPQLWLGFSGVYFQPSEALKIIMAAFLASYLAEQYPLLRADGLALSERNRLLTLSPRVIGPVLLMWFLSVVILIWQRDLGTAVLFFVVFLILLYIASGYTLILVGGLMLIALAAVVGYSLFDVVRLRIDIWLNPWPEADGRAYQIVQSLQAFAAGGVFGQGIGQGSPTYIPVVHSDFVFAALAEEWGLLGVIVVLSCMAMLITSGLRIATMHQGKPFQALLAIGLSALLAVQTVMITGGVMRVVPLTGVTLPFLSYGGSSLLTSFIIVGLLLNLSANQESI